MTKVFKLFFVSTVIVISVLFMITSVSSSCCVSVFTGVSPFVVGVSDKVVSNETELVAAVNGAVGFTIIALNNDIVLTDELVIPANKNITLTSTGDSKFKLFGANGTVSYEDTIVVGNKGMLRLENIIVTHKSGVIGSGVRVNDGGTCILSSGEISGNRRIYRHGGVYNEGAFIMTGGLISNNDGGVFNCGILEMSGGVISNNQALLRGGGVWSIGRFIMTGGLISNNTAQNTGGGVLVSVAVGDFFGNAFVMSGGEISSNVALSETGFGGGVDVQSGSFIMSGGVISNNKAANGGGVYNGAQGLFNTVFEMSGGFIINNVADSWGGGVWNYHNFSLSGGEISSNVGEFGGGVHNSGNFSMSGGLISNNAAFDGGGVYIGSTLDNAITEIRYKAGVFDLSGGKISGNIALKNGGGVWVDEENLVGLFVSNGVVFSNNQASEAFYRASKHDAVYVKQIGEKVTWTTPFTQGYNNYDISYTDGSQVTDLADEDYGQFGVLLVVVAVFVISIVIGVLFYLSISKRERKSGKERINLSFSCYFSRS
jgi:hypothetical protein